MTWEEATKLSLILTVAAFFSTFLLPYSWIGLKENIGQFLFEAVRFLGTVFFTNFASLAGITVLQQKSKTEEKPTEETNQ